MEFKNTPARPFAAPTFSPRRSPYELQAYVLLEEIRFLDKVSAQAWSETQFVGVSMCGATRSTDSKPNIGTTSLLSCVATAIHDSKHSISGVLHAFFPPRELHHTGNLEKLFAQMLGLTDQLGGAAYKVVTFNMFNGLRLPEQTRDIVDTITHLVSSLSSQGKVLSVEHRNEHNFILNSRDGSLHVADRIEA